MTTTGLLVLEGHDRAGKTFLAKRLVERFGARYYHCGYRFKGRIFAYHAAILRQAVSASATQLVVIDRLWLSEVIYAAVYRGGTRWPHQGRMVDRVLLRWCAINVICATDPSHAGSVEPDAALAHTKPKAAEVCRHYLAVAPDNDQAIDPPAIGSPVTVGRLVTLPGTYAGALQAAGRKGDTLRYDYRAYPGVAIDGFIDQLTEALRRRKIAQFLPAFDASNMNLLGYAPAARYLAVGDRTNAKNDKVAWPFFEYGNCSLYLANACQVAGLDEERVVWLNAHGNLAREHVAGLAHCYGLKVVALGRHASARLNDWGVDHETIRHPQAARRFTHHDVSKYADELSGAMPGACSQ